MGRAITLWRVGFQVIFRAITLGRPTGAAGDGIVFNFPEDEATHTDRACEDFDNCIGIEQLDNIVPNLRFGAYPVGEVTWRHDGTAANREPRPARAAIRSWNHPVGEVFIFRAVGEPGQPAPIRVYHIEVVMVLRPGYVGYPPPIRRPVKVPLGLVIVDEPGLLGSIRQHHVDLGMAVPVGQEGDMRSIRRPVGEPVGTRIVREIGSTPAAVRVHDKDLGIPLPV